jgi:iron complex transport system substrate-binding protein
MASLINDAGGNYLLSHLAGSRSYPFSIENAMEYAAKADIWINTGTVNSVSDISAELPILKGLPIISSESIFNNNCCVNASGGNDFWESGVINPHIILKDLVKIFHPHQLEHQLVYYKKVKK